MRDEEELFPLKNLLPPLGEKLDKVVKELEKLPKEERGDIMDKIESNYIEAILKLLSDGPMSAGWKYVENGVIVKLELSEPRLKRSSVYAIIKENEKTKIVRNEKFKAHAEWKATWEAIDYILTATDYRELSVKFLECRRYPTDTRKIEWRTLIKATDAYQNGLFHFYRKMGMY